MKQKNLVIIPVFNEAATIAAVLKELCADYSGDILVIDDGSSDGSSEIVSALNNPRISQLSHENNQGYGAALIDGFQYALETGYQTAVTMDCDFQHCPKQVNQFLEECGDCDILSGSRYLKDSPLCSQAPEDRQWINQVITERINEITGFNLSDAFCGFKAYKVEELGRFELSEPGYGCPLQLWIQAYALGISVKEIPVARLYPHLDRSFGEELDDPANRLRYYESVIEKELRRWKLT